MTNGESGTCYVSFPMSTFSLATSRQEIVDARKISASPLSTSSVTPGLTLFLKDVLRVFLRSEEHTSELQSRQYLVCRLLLEKKNGVCRMHEATTTRGPGGRTSAAAGSA